MPGVQDRTAALASECDAAQQARDETAASLCAKERELEEAALTHHRLTTSLEEQLADAEAMAKRHKGTLDLVETRTLPLSTSTLASMPGLTFRDFERDPLRNVQRLRHCL